MLTRHLSDDGIVLSGGEEQKLAMSRALYKNAPIAIFDEPTASLDPLAERDVMEHFHKLTAGKTVFFISHRLSSCRLSDVILVVEDGRLVEQGSHRELLAANGQYSRLWRTQSKWYQDT